MQKTPRKWKTSRSLAVAGVALVAGLGVAAVAVPALAAQDPVLTPEQQSTVQTQVDAYRACLSAQGVTLPTKPANGTKPQLTDEQRAAMKAAHDACESSEPTRPTLTDEQRVKLQAQEAQYRSCVSAQLSASGITVPTKPADGTPAAPPADGQRPARPQLTDEQKAAFEAARTACVDLRPNLGVDGLGPMGGPGGHGPGGFGGPGGRGGPGGPGSRSGSATTTSSAV